MLFGEAIVAIIANTSLYLVSSLKDSVCLLRQCFEKEIISGEELKLCGLLD